jgi:iron complex outermembrane receptor protein
VVSLTDLGTVTPGLVFPTSGIGGSPRLRGVGTQISVGGNENSVATYVDGVYYPSAAANVMAFNSVAQVAVLKGPQGTLFGRNATGGLLQITTRDPGQTFNGSAQVGYGNRNTYSGNAYLGGPIGSNLAADIAVDYRNREDGFGVNLFNGKKVGTLETFAVRSKWKAQLGKSTTATLIGDYSKLKGAFPAYRPVPGELTLIGPPLVGNKFDVNSDVQPMSDSEEYGVSLNLSHEFGGFKLVSISAYRHSDWKFDFDSESLPLPILSANGAVPDKMFSQELAAGLQRRREARLGAGALLLQPQEWLRAGSSGRACAGFPAGFQHTGRTPNPSPADGQMTYRISDATAFTAGLRLTTEKKSYLAEGVFRNLSPAFNAPLGPTADSKKVTKLTWRASLDHHLSKDVMVYASYNRGFKSGGYDPTSVAVASYIRPEVLDAFEVGVKSDLLDRHLRINAAGYYYDFKDIQLNTYINGLPAVYNGKSAKSFRLRS